MGSNRAITPFLVVVVCLIFIASKDGSTTYAAPQMQEEQRHEYQYQRSSKIATGSTAAAGYYNGASALDEWGTTTQQKQNEQITGMVEKLRTELAHPQSAAAAVAACTARCALLPTFVGKTTEEINSLATAMTTEILADLQSGKLDRTEVNRPQWLEHRVALKLEELNRQQQQYQSNRFRTQNQIGYDAGGGGDEESVQQTQQNVFDEHDLSQVQHTFSNQRQYQQMGNGYYQEQSQNQHNRIYSRPTIVRQYTAQQENREINRVAPTISVVAASEWERRNEDAWRQTVPLPSTPSVISSTRTTERDDSTYNSGHSQVAAPIRPITSTYNRETERREEDYEQRRHRPSVPIPTATTTMTRESHRNEYEERRHHPPHLVQHTQYTRTNEDIAREEAERSATVVVPTQPTVTRTEEQQQQYEERRRRIQTPVPVSTTEPRHSIYQHLEVDEERVRNYVPRVTLRSDAQFETMDHHRQQQSSVVPAEQPPTVLQHTETESETYVERLSGLRADLRRCGFAPFQQQSDYNETIARGSFDRNGYRYRYNPDTRHFEQTEQRVSTTIERTDDRVKEEHDWDRQSSSQPFTMNITDEQYVERLSQVREQLESLGYTSLNEEIYNSTIFSGGFTHNGYKYLYNEQSGRFEQTDRIEEHGQEQHRQQTIEPTPSTSWQPQSHRQEERKEEERHHQHHEVVRRVQPLHLAVFNAITSDEEYRERYERLRHELYRLGYTDVTDAEYNETIANGGFAHDGYKHVWINENGRYEKSDRPQMNTDEMYGQINRELRRQLQTIGYTEQMSSQEINQTLSTGVFVRAGCKYIYNAATERYDRNEIGQEEKLQIFRRIQEILERLGYRQISMRENEQVLQRGQLIRGGWRWYYNAAGSTLEKSTDYVGENAELSTDEYAMFYKRVQDALRRLNYQQMSQKQCNATISSGQFERGGIRWRFNAESEQFERVELSQSDYMDRLQVLRNRLTELNHRVMSVEELRAIVYNGYFYHEGYRYEYNKETGHFERLEITDEEYAERLQRLRVQLKRIGFGEMTEQNCNETITSGVFYFNGYEWLYNFDTANYEQGQRSELGRHRYGSEISKNRGDQPPQHFNADYESEEVLEQEPGVGFYAAKPEVRLAAEPTYNQMASATTTPQPTTRYNSEERHRQEYERHRELVAPPAPIVRSEYERRYQRTQTSYVATNGMMPINYGTEERLPEQETVTEFDVYPTEAYTVGSHIDGPRARATGMNRRSPTAEDRVEDFGQMTQSVAEQESQPAEELRQQLVDVTAQETQDIVQHSNLQASAQLSEDVRQRQESADLQALQRAYDAQQHRNEDTEDLRQYTEDLLRQQYVDPASEDLRQQHVQPEDLRQQQHSEPNNWQQHTGEDVVQKTDEKNDDDEQQAQVTEVTTEKPGLWTRFKDKTRNIFG